jgi:DNA helicase-2/ATP-dependent DNA helicase PcrA
LTTGLARPWEILAVTFSVRAADELRLRLREMLGLEVAGGVTAATFHSVCARLLREHAQQFGRSGDWTVYDQQEVRKTIEWLMSAKQRGEVAQTVRTWGLASAEIQREIAAAKNRLLSPDAYVRLDTHQAAPLIADVWRELETEMRRLNAIDFDDLLVLAVTLLSERRMVLSSLRERWPWLVVDEVQDSCPAQLELTALLAGPDGNVCCVGDPDQVIYAFRQADPSGMRRLAARFPGHRPVVLSRNFRSRAEILHAACRCVQHNTGREPRALFAVRGAGGEARAVAFGSEREEAEWIAATVGKALAARWPASEVLILSRTSYATAAVQQALRHAGIAHRVLGSLGLYERAEARTAIAYLTLLSNPRDVQAFARAISSPRRGIGADAQNRIVSLARAGHGDDLLAACGDPEASQCVRGEQALAKLRDFARGMRTAREELDAGRSLGHVAVGLLTMRGGLVASHQCIRDRSHSEQKRRDAERVLEDLRSLCRHVQAYEQGESSPSLIGFLELAAGLDSRQIAEGEEDERITISTIHRCKGGEARLVILLGCEERLLPIRQALETGDTAPLEEERRLFYVACTRAKDRLYLTHCARRGGRATGGPSRFLTEAGLIESPGVQLAA